MPQQQYTASTKVNVANLNTTFPYDAIVSAGATPSGAIYATVDAAIDAGHKFILVETGVYAGFTADVNGLHIVAATKSYFVSSDFSGGVEFNSTITVSGNGVILEDLSVDAASGVGFSITGNYCELRGCQACLCATDGASLTTVSIGTKIFGGRYGENGADGISVAHDEVWLTDVDAGANTGDGIVTSGTGDIRIHGCLCDSNGAYGIDQGSSGSVWIQGCFVRSNSTGQVNGTNACDFASANENVVA